MKNIILIISLLIGFHNTFCIGNVEKYIAITSIGMFSAGITTTLFVSAMTANKADTFVCDTNSKDIVLFGGLMVGCFLFSGYGMKQLSQLSQR